MKSTHEISEADIVKFQCILSTIVTGVSLVTKVVFATMRSQEPPFHDPAAPERGVTRGTIVNLGSASAFVSSPGMAPYRRRLQKSPFPRRTPANDSHHQRSSNHCRPPPFTRTSRTSKAVLGRQSQKLVDAVTDAVLLEGIDVGKISVGKRIDLRDVLQMEIDGSDREPVVVVSGPPGMANDVRAVVVDIMGKRRVHVRLVDEGIS